MMTQQGRGEAPLFNSQHPHGALQPSVTAVSWNTMPSAIYRHCSVCYAQVLTSKHIRMNK